MAGVRLPVSPRKRMVFHFDCRTRIADAPLTIDTSGVYFRPEGPNYIAGSSPRGEQPDPETLDLEVDRSWFEEVIWPAIAHRVPAFEAIRLLDAWAGHYEVNTLDHNAVIGPHPDLPNFLFANGFSGHGLQQAPAADVRSRSGSRPATTRRSTCGRSAMSESRPTGPTRSSTSSRHGGAGRLGRAPTGTSRRTARHRQRSGRGRPCGPGLRR